MPMFTRHFLKALIAFTVIIFLGLVGVFFLGSLEESGEDVTDASIAE